MRPGQQRELDVVLVGCTGFVGRLTAWHLAEQAPSGLRVALAGRSPERLEALRAELGRAASGWPLRTVDTLDEQAVTDLASSTRVVVSTVGPYLRYGSALLHACAEAGTDYADLTGETLFVRRAIERSHQTARRTGARIVPSCGFDSVPSDLAVGLTAERARADGAGELVRAELQVGPARGGISGGTIDSLRQQAIETGRDPGLRRLVAADRALCTDGSASGAAGPARAHRPRRRRDPATGQWLAPFALGGYNRQIVLRSRWLVDPEHADLDYREVIPTGRTPLGAVTAAGIGAGIAALTAAMTNAGTRRLLDRVLPAPGQGPGERTLQRGHFRVRLHAETTDGSRYRTTVAADRDPGYGATAVMLGQSALCLALDELPQAGGVLTPMTALGGRLPDRLRRQGFTIETDLERPAAAAAG